MKLEYRLRTNSGHTWYLTGVGETVASGTAAWRAENLLVDVLARGNIIAVRQGESPRSGADQYVRSFSPVRCRRAAAVVTTQCRAGAGACQVLHLRGFATRPIFKVINLPRCLAR